VTEAAAFTREERRRFFRSTGMLAFLMAASLALMGRFRAAAALTLGAAVAIVGALWLAELVHRFGRPEASAPAETSWNFVATGLLRYGAAAVLVWAAVGLFPREVPWILLGTSVAVMAAVWQAVVKR
jgi:hypothetical protein